MPNMLHTPNKKKFPLWSNYDVKIKDFADFLSEEHSDVTDEDEKQRLCEELNDEYLDDERLNLRFLRACGEIVILADLGFWDGRHDGAKRLNTDEVSQCLQFQQDCDYAEWYIDRFWNLRSNQTHHDASHHLLYRAFKPWVTEAQKDFFVHAVATGTVTNAMISKLTHALGKQIGEIYGWCK